jgi:hypothetical protein
MESHVVALHNSENTPKTAFSMAPGPFRLHQLSKIGLTCSGDWHQQFSVTVLQSHFRCKYRLPNGKMRVIVVLGNVSLGQEIAAKGVVSGCANRCDLGEGGST